MILVLVDSLQLPRQVRDFAKVTRMLAKTDAIDAELIAHFATAIYPMPAFA